MPTAVDLVGLGLPHGQAQVLGNQPTALTCTGNDSQSGGATILSHLVTLTTGASTNTAVLPSTALVGTPYYFFNSSATTANVYCPSGTTMNGTSNGKQTVAQNKLAFAIQISKGVWASWTAA
jgi:hypothetical protein